MSRLGLRRRLLLAVSTAVTVALVGLVAGFNVILSGILNRDARDLARTHASAEIDSLQIDHGRLRVTESPDDRSAGAYLWIFSAGRTLEQPRVATELNQAARRLAASSGRGRFADVSETDTRLYAVPIVAHGRRLGIVVAGVSLSPFEETRKLALLASVVLAAAVLLVVILASRWLLRASLQPMVQMTRQAAEWSEHNLEHRFTLGPPQDELTELAATLNGLLDRLAASLRHERRFSAELSHELRTPLARVRAEAELALRRPRQPPEYQEALAHIQLSAEQLSRTIDALVAAARYEAGAKRGIADARTIAEDAVRSCQWLASERAITLEILPPVTHLHIGTDRDLAERILQPVLENACRYGAHHVQITIGRQSSSVVYTVDDDGPGVSSEERDRIFEPGVRGRRATAEQGAGLGLSLARRLARSIEGDVLVDSDANGGRFVIRLPAA